MNRLYKSVLALMVAVSVQVSGFATGLPGVLVIKKIGADNVYKLLSEPNNGEAGTMELYTLQYASLDGGVVTVDNGYDVNVNGGQYLVVSIGGDSKTLSLYNNMESTAVSLNLGEDVERIAANALSTWTSLTTLTLQSATAPTLGAGALPSSLTKIVVPTGKADEYATSIGWSAYASIIEDVNGVKPSSVTALNEVGQEVGLKLRGNVLSIGKTASVLVYNLAGQKVFGGTASEVTLPGRGVYIVSVDGKKSRLVAR